MSFAHPGILGLVVLALPALAVFLMWAWRSRVRAIDAFLPPALRTELDIQSSGTQALLRGTLLVLIILSLLVALARPRYGLGSTEVNQRGLDILVGIDTSRSMLAEDTGPGLSRLQRAKLAALDLARAAKRDRVGLIAFAGTAFLQCPLTVDDEAFRQSVDSLDTTTIPQGGTALGAAIDTALDAFRSEPDGVRTLVLFTDGEEHETGAVDAAKRAATKGLRVYTVGVGTARGEVIRLRDDKGVESFLKDEQGNVVKSTLNEALLQEVAKTTGGLYLPLQGARVMQELYTQGLQPLPRTEFSSKSIQQYRERFQWPLGFALALLLAEYLLPERRLSRRGKRSRSTPVSSRTPPPVVATPPATPTPPRATAPEPEPTLPPQPQPHLDAVAGWVLTALILGLGTVGAAASPRSAYRQFEKGDFTSAEEEYARLAEQNPDDPRLTFNAGLAAYRAKEFSKAAGHFGEALRAPDLRVQHDAYFNLGNARYFEGTGENDPAARSKLWEQALQNYESALRLAPQDTNAVNNREFVQRQLEELRRQQPPPQKSGDQKQDSQKDSKDDQKQDSQSSADQKSKPDQDSKSDSPPPPPSKSDTQQNPPSDPKDDSSSGADSKDSKDQDAQDSQPKPKPGDDAKDAKEPKDSPDSPKKDSPPKDSPSSRSAAGQKKPDGKDAGSEGTAGEAGAEEETPLGQMSSKQALRLLDTAKGEEKLMPLEKRRARPRGFKDW